MVNLMSFCLTCIPLCALCLMTMIYLGVVCTICVMPIQAADKVLIRQQCLEYIEVP